MSGDYVKIYDKDMRLQAILENASGIGYEMKTNALWTAKFTMPVNDPKTAYCQPFNYAEIFEAGERIELFRIMPYDKSRSDSGPVVEYQCEHVKGTLIDDIMFRLHELLSLTTTDVLQYILSKQTTVRWTLGTCSFNRGFDYKFENENLLAALLAIPKPFTGEYLWTFDTTSYPWTINLVEPSTSISAYVRYRKNLRGIKQNVDPTNMITRIYPLGSGEGINQLGIEKAADNTSGLPYIDADTIGTWGIVAKPWVDKRYESPDTLYAAGQAVLELSKNPIIAYEIDVADLYIITKSPVDKFTSGALIRVIDEDLGFDVITRVVNKSKNDIFGAPGDMKIQISNNMKDISDTIARMTESQKINEAYSQGATNIDSSNYVDNCDSENPAVFKLYIPEEVVRVNKAIMAFEVGPFRAYSKSAAAGGATVTSTEAGGASTQTSSAGGASTQTSSAGGGSTQTSSAGGGVSTTTEAGGGAVTTTPAGGNHFHKLFQGGAGAGVDGLTKYKFFGHFKEAALVGPVNLEAIDGGNLYTYEADGDHSHDVTLPAHSHNFSVPAHTHTVNIPAHTHTVDIPAHTHTVDIPAHSHEIILEDHTHELIYGIYEAPAAGSITLKIDGNTVTSPPMSATDFDLIPYLTKGTDGRVTRGEWHTIEFTPDTLARVNLTVVTQCYVRSKGGGDY